VLTPALIGLAATAALSSCAATATTAVLTVIASRPAEPVLSRGNPQSALQIMLDLGADKRWRFCSFESSANAGATDDPSVP
jgi:hypothetical protein